MQTATQKSDMPLLRSRLDPQHDVTTTGQKGCTPMETQLQTSKLTQHKLCTHTACAKV